ncbi:MAG: LLM class flavin-dependent oxidoreductase [Gammaproteobacteria bacterium]|nr:MAG: LLM class flavin-dependent oxidoreductase [Gammaproteobacteria bacterium]
MRIDLIFEASHPGAKLAELARLAERYGFGGVWVSNMHDARDPFINFVQTALATQRITVGPVAVSPYELHPMKMAAALLTLNEVSGGRAQIGIAAGGGGAPTAMGVTPQRRLRAVRECVEILKLASSGKPLRYKGEIYKVLYYHPSFALSAPPMIWVCANGPQMLRSAAKYADGIFVGDHTPEDVGRMRAIVDAQHADSGRASTPLRFNNFWAWHVKETREAAHREARRWLAIRATPYPEYYYRDILPEDEMQIIWKNRQAIIRAFNAGSDVIEGIPADIMARFVDKATSASGLDQLDFEIERLRRFQAAGLTEISLRIYENPQWTIQLLGERVLPALR